ncbi:MAG: hypothetical protein ACREED_09655 [Stellaceae bacterium]
MKNWIGPLGRAVLAAAVVAILVGGTATAFAQDYDRGHDGHYGYGGDDRDWHDNDHRPPPGYYYRPGYVYQAPPPVVYAPPPPQYAPPVDLFFSIGIRCSPTGSLRKQGSRA